ncbi:MAG TPA: glycosyltransferase family 2 protein [Gemmatimonadaceae bacterium]|nr:glycosyltransferase family 2 protein [Gemmatimonadaceae bacterium]
MQNSFSGDLVFRLSLAIVLTGVVAVLLMPVVSELLCVLVSWRRVRPGKAKAELPRLLFLVPAHNEELLITKCVRSLLALAYPASHRRVVVIADNCTDSTARLAREEGAETLERSDPAAPGKPRALAWAIAQIELGDWDACVIVDADSTVAPTFALGLGELAPLNDIIFQPNNWVLNEFENWLTRLGGLLGRNRFYVTYPLKQSAGLNCPISNGMGFGTKLLMRDGWRSFSITEDTELYAVYTAEGVRIRHAPAANLFSQEAHSLPQGAIQRRRWIAGRVHIIREWGPRLLRSKKIGWRQKLDALVELALPAPVLHLLVTGATIAAALVGVRGKPGWWIAAAAAASLSGIVVTTIAAMWNHPQPWRTLASFFMLPVYAVWRVLVVVKTVVTVRDTTWQRTGRTGSIGGTVAVQDRPA